MQRAEDDELRQAQVRQACPEIYEAYILYSRRGRLRDGLEALLLVGIPVEDIARCLALEREVVATYSNVWFDVPLTADQQMRLALSLVPEAYRPGFGPGDPGYWLLVGVSGNLARLTNLICVLAPLLLGADETMTTMVQGLLARKLVDAAEFAGGDPRAITAAVTGMLTYLRTGAVAGAAWRVVVHRVRVQVVAAVGPQPALAGAVPILVQHRHRGVVGVQGLGKTGSAGPSPHTEDPAAPPPGVVQLEVTVGERQGDKQDRLQPM